MTVKAQYQIKFLARAEQGTMPQCYHAAEFYVSFSPTMKGRNGMRAGRRRVERLESQYLQAYRFTDAAILRHEIRLPRLVATGRISV